MTQLFVSYNGKFPDVAEIARLSDAPDSEFGGSTSAKFSPFSGEKVTFASDKRAILETAHLRDELIGIGTCKCGESHRADVASVSHMLDKDCAGFYCMACASEVPLNVDLKDYHKATKHLIASELEDETDDEFTPDYSTEDDTLEDDTVTETDAETDAEDSESAETEDTEDDEDVNIDEMSEADFAALVQRYTKQAKHKIAASLDMAEFEDEESTDSDMESDESEDDEDYEDDDEFTSEPEEPETAPVSETDGFNTETLTEPVDNTTPAPEVTESAETESQDAPQEVDETSEDDPKEEAGLFKKTADNTSDSTIAEIVENPLAEDTESEESEDEYSDGAKLLALDTKVDFATADIACVLNQKATKYFVFANNIPVGTLSRDLAHATNASVFERDAFIRGFKMQVASGKPVQHFGYRPFTVKVDISGIKKDIAKAIEKKAATDIASNYDNRIDAMKKSLVIAAVAANKGVWGDFANPVKDALIAKLTRYGFDAASAAQVVTTTFAEKSTEYVESLLGKALELANKSPEHREIISNMVETANYQIAGGDPSNVAEKLAKIGQLEKLKLADAASPVKPADKATAGYDWASAVSRIRGY